VSPRRGDVVEVDWLDIAEDPVGDPRKAEIARRKSVGCYWGWKNQHGRRVLVTTTTKDAEDLQHSSGYCAYPWSVVLGLKILKREGKR
jgi:hypothetical protein